MLRRHFAHRPNVIANGCFDIAPTPLAQQYLPMSTLCQTFSFKCCVGPTLVRHDFVLFNLFYKFDSHNFVLILIMIYSNTQLFSFLSKYGVTIPRYFRLYLYFFNYRSVIHQFRRTIFCHTQNSSLVRS